MLRRRGPDTVLISKVKGHAVDGMVLHGQVRREDKLGNDAADEAADFGRRRVSPAVIDARRNLSGVCGRWYPVVLDLHRFFIAICRAVVDLLLTLLSGLLVPIVSGVGWSMRFGIGLFCPGPLASGVLSGFRFLLLLFVTRMLIFGLTLRVFWSSEYLS